MDFRTEGLAQLAARVARREVSARELAQAALDRIEQLNPAYNAFCAVDADRALADADAVDARIAAGEDAGPLAGIPIGVKDNMDTAGYRTTGGSITRKDAPAAERDSIIVERLKGAGCVVVGKTNMPEFGLRGETDNRLFGITRNPWNRDRTPGGSSGGTSAALASGMVPLATGSDGGGSIRIPSTTTGLSGFKPTQGRIPDGDPNPPGWPLLSTRGPMSRKIADVALALDAVVGPHDRDARCLPRPDGSFADAAARAELPTRVVWSRTLGYAEVDSEIGDVCEAAVRKLEAAGVEVVEMEDVFAEDPGISLGGLVQTYISRTAEPFRDTEFWDQLDPWVIAVAEMNAVGQRSAIDVAAALDGCHHVNIRLAEVLSGNDLLLCPTTRGQTALCEVPVTVDAMLAVSDTRAIADMLGERYDVLLDVIRRMEPVNAPIGSVNGQPSLEWHGMTQAFNVTRSPAGTVCAGFTADGMPVGLQVAGHQLADLQVVSAMSAIEQLLGVDTIAPL